MIKTDLFTRLTYQYADGWQHLDSEEFTGTVKVLGATRQIEGAGYDDGGAAHFRVVAPSALKGRDLSRAIGQTLGGSSCRHEHDCCGCATHRASVKRVSPREYAVKVSVSFNY
jgi:hypothetical protein